MAIHNRKNTSPEKSTFTFYWVRREYDVSRNWQTSWVMLCSDAVCVLLVRRRWVSLVQQLVPVWECFCLAPSFHLPTHSWVTTARYTEHSCCTSAYDSDLHYLCLEVMNFLTLNIKWNLLCGSVCNIQECHIVCKHQYVLAYWNPLALEVGLLNPARGPGGTL